MEIFIVILIAFIILLFLIQHIKKWVIKISNDLVDGINQNIIQKENMIETNIKLLSKASIELENILKKNLKPIKKYVKSKKIPEIREFYKQHLILQKKPFLLPYETIDTELVLNSLRYSMWDTKNNNKIVQQRFFIWFTELIFEKKLNITDFNVINKKRFDEYGMNEGYLIILKYIKTDEYNSVLKARLKDKSSIEVDIKWHDWDNYHRKDYYFKSIRGIFEEDYNDLIKTINNKLIALYDGLDNILNKNEKIMIISLHEYLEFLSEACGIYANISINPYFLNDKNVAELKEADALLEHVIYNGYQYGFTKDEVSSKLKEGDVSAVLNIDGVKAFINSEFKDDVYPFFLNVSLEKVKKNMETRDDTPENKEKRVSLFNQEINNKSFFEQLKNSTVIDVEDMNVKELSFLFAELLH